MRGLVIVGSRTDIVLRSTSFYQFVGDPPTLAYLGILNCYLFIGYLDLDHEMDFEINLFFSFTKVP